MGGRGAAAPPRWRRRNVRQKINALARLSESLRARADRGLVPAALGRSDIENFLNRLAYLESTGRSAATTATSSAGVSAPPWPGSARWG